MRISNRSCLALLGTIVALTGQIAEAASHLWRINEVFSNPDGTVQFVELKECCGSTGENFIAGKTFTSQTTGSSFPFPSNLPGSTANKHLLLATAAFDALPNSPTPDYIMVDNFIGKGVGDTLRYAPVQNYDTFTFGADALPLNGVLSIQITNFTTHTFVTGTNSPTNYAGVTGSVVAPACVDTDGDGYGSPGDASCPNGSAADCNNNNNAIHPGATELCTDGIDNDCDDRTDCTDTVCAAVVPCIPTITEFGVLVMALLLMSAGSIVVLRRRSIVRAT